MLQLQKNSFFLVMKKKICLCWVSMLCKWFVFVMFLNFWDKKLLELVFTKSSRIGEDADGDDLSFQLPLSHF